MGQQEYDAFRERMKQWMLDNADAYDEFEEMMNSQSDVGYQRIMGQAIALVPKYGKAISKKINSSYVGDTLDIEELFSDENLGIKLVGQFEKNSIATAMICWLFFGRSFENMVECGEEIISSTGTNRFQKILIASTTKLFISKSINLGLRTRQDWEEYNNFRKVIDSNQVMDWALESPEKEQPQTTPLQKVNKVLSLKNMILLNDEKKNMLLDKIEEYINTGVKGKRIAFMILTLRQLGYLPETTSDRQLFTAIKTRFNSYIGSDKSIYAYLDNGVSKQFKSDIDNLTTYFNVN
jgi:hypothetical protein